MTIKSGKNTVCFQAINEIGDVRIQENSGKTEMGENLNYKRQKHDAREDFEDFSGRHGTACATAKGQQK